MLGNKLRISLIEFLTTGSLGCLWIGQTKQQAVALLGEPVVVGGTSYRHRVPSIYKYADLELCFRRHEPSTCTSLHIGASESKRFCFPKVFFVDDWELSLADSRTDVVRYLDRIRADYSLVETDANSIPAFRLKRSGVGIYFDDEEKLEQFSLSFDDLPR